MRAATDSQQIKPGDIVELVRDVRFLKAGSHGIVEQVRQVSGERVYVLDIAPRLAFRVEHLRVISEGGR